jgi:hypothetical protein
MLNRRRTVVTNNTAPMVPPTNAPGQQIVYEYDRRY